MTAETCKLVSSQVVKSNAVMLHEEKVKEIGKNSISLRYLDSGASNHMTSDKNCFTELDKTITGRVKFGDGSIVDITGQGSVLFECKNGEHPILSRAYYIPRLKSNIISLGQLDELGNQTSLKMVA